MRPAARFPASVAPLSAVLAACLVAAAWVPGPAGATVLTFEPTTVNFQPTDQDYGDRVTAVLQDGFEYGDAEGFTPNVTVAYGPIGFADPQQWTVGFGDLTGVLYENHDGWGILEITLSADLGTLVELLHFDMAAWRWSATIRNLRVTNAAGDVLYNADDLFVPHVGHSSFDFDPPLVGRSITIRIDSGNLFSHSDDIGIDNITFRQTSAPTAVTPVTWSRTKSLYR